MAELAATSQEKRRFNRTMRQVALVLALGLAVGAIFYGSRNSGGLGDVNAKVDRIESEFSQRAQKREDQDACAAKINAAWSAAFGQAAIAPVGSAERTRHAIEGAQVLPHLQNIDVECYGAPATTTLPPTTTVPITPSGSTPG